MISNLPNIRENATPNEQQTTLKHPVIVLTSGWLISLVYTGTEVMAEAEQWPKITREINKTLKFGARAHNKVANMKTVHSNSNNFFRPNLSLKKPPQIAPVQLPMTMILANLKIQNINY